MESFAKKMHRFKPDYIQGYAGSVNIFAAFILEHEYFKIHPKAVFTTSETLLSHYRKTIRRAFSCETYNHYGCSETSTIAAQCGHNEGLHVFDENVVLETIKDDEHASLEEEGRVLLTNLHNFAMPFIRYEVGDSGKILPGICPCGRELSLFKPIGRSYEYFVNSNGSFTNLRDFRTVFEDLPIKDYQVVQESSGEIVLKIACRYGYTKAHTDFILNNIKFAGPADVRIELVDSIPPGKSGKMTHYVQEIATNHT
jgi:phenylacetate-CoA ligase